MLTTLENKPEKFLDWLFNRLKFKYKEEELVLSKIQNVLNDYIILPKKIPINLIDQICKKHYPDFEMDKVPEMNMGYTDAERMQIRNLVLSIIADVNKF